MNCDSARTEIIAYLKNELEPGKRKHLEEHFAKCPECRKELEQARKLLTWTEAASDDAIVKCVDDIINQAIGDSASDIHLESQRDNSLTVRYRIDGVLHETHHIPAVNRHGVLARLKMLADLSVADTSLPQDGRFYWTFRDREFDLRLSSVPYVYGEGMVIRILDRSSALLGLDRLGFYPEQMQAMESMIHQPNGLFIVSGPTGSGKTTTLYSVLTELISQDNKVMTVEDPVEVTLPGANQVHVNKRAGLTFEAATRAFFRQDPDIIMVGDASKLETKSMLVEGALTGHLILSILHTNDALSVVTRLADMGIEPYLIAATLVGAVSQRLARIVCKECGEEIDADLNAPALRYLGITEWDLKEHKIRRGRGCEHCRFTGYRGRTGVYEMLRIDSELRALIANGLTGPEFAEAARARGFLDMRADARRKVLDGIITPEEAMRILQPQ